MGQRGQKWDDPAKLDDGNSAITIITFSRADTR